MLKEVIDPNVKRDASDKLRSLIHKARMEQEYENGRRHGYDEGFEAGVQVGFNRAIEDIYNIIGSFVKGDRS